VAFKKQCAAPPFALTLVALLFELPAGQHCRQARLPQRRHINHRHKTIESNPCRIALLVRVASEMIGARGGKVSA